MVVEWDSVLSFSYSTQARHNKAISRDTWSQLLEFARVRYHQRNYSFMIVYPLPYMYIFDGLGHVKLM